MTPEEQEQIDQTLARAIYSSGTPLSIWKTHTAGSFQVTKTVIPFAQQHSASKLLLVSEYEWVMESVQGRIDRVLSLAYCPWVDKGERRQTLKPYDSTATSFKQTGKSAERGENSFRAEYISYKICVIRQTIGSSKAFALLTGNARNMKAAPRITHG